MLNLEMLESRWLPNNLFNPFFDLPLPTGASPELITYMESLLPVPEGWPTELSTLTLEEVIGSPPPPGLSPPWDGPLHYHPTVGLLPGDWYTPESLQASVVPTFDVNTAVWSFVGSEPFAYGAPGWQGLLGDWNGDGMKTVGVFDPSTAIWYLRDDNSPGAPDAGQFAYGAPGWIPITFDWDGSGYDKVGVVDPTGAAYLAVPGDVIIRPVEGLAYHLPLEG